MIKKKTSFRLVRNEDIVMKWIIYVAPALAIIIFICLFRVTGCPEKGFSSGQ